MSLSPPSLFYIFTDNKYPGDVSKGFFDITAIPLHMGTPRIREMKPANSDPTVNKQRRQNSQPGLLTLNSTLSREEHLYLL